MRTKKEGAVEDKGIRSGLDNMFSALPVATGCLGHEFKRRTCFEASTWKRNEGREGIRKYRSKKDVKRKRRERQY